MKKFYTLLIISVLSTSGSLFAQYAPWQPSQGPLNFNTISAPYVKCTYSTSLEWSGDNEPPAITSPGINQSNGRVSHRIVTTNGNDPCRCESLGGSNYYHEPILPPSWNMDWNNPQDTVVMLGCNDCSSGCAVCNDHSQIEYWFYPQEGNSTLLVMFTFAEEDVTTHNASNQNNQCQGTCYSTKNPQFYIEVLDGETNQLIPSGYYKSPNGNPNPNWPYNRFMACPDGCQSCESFQVGPDQYGITTYYWAHPKATPTTFNFRRCPSSQTSGHSSQTVGWFEYKPIAFDLSAHAAQHRSVKLRIRCYACSAEFHWAYCMFTAKMIPNAIQVDACGYEDVALSVPPGFRETHSYIWRFGYDSLDACNRYLNVDEPPAGITCNGLYDIYINRDSARLWPYYRCEMYSYTGAPFVYEAHIKSYYLDAGFDFEQKYDNCDLTVQFHDTSSIISVIPPTSAGATEDTIVQQTQFIQWQVKRFGQFIQFAENDTTPTYTFDNSTVDTTTGEATIRIIIQDEEQRCSDTLEKTIFLDLTALQTNFGTDTIYTCEEKLPYVYDAAYFGDTQSWSTEGTRRVKYESLGWNGCDSLVDVTLIIRKPKVNVVFDLDYCDEFTTTLSAETESDVTEYKWNTGETTPSITITTPGTYSVVITDEEGCVSDPPGTITIPACKPFLNLANSITPSNMDGINDYFFIPQSNLIQELEFTVYNRNGDMVYHTTNKDFRWNGSENGKLFVGATYTYTLYIIDYEGISSRHKGSITIL